MKRMRWLTLWSVILGGFIVSQPAYSSGSFLRFSGTVGSATCAFDVYPRHHEEEPNDPDFYLIMDVNNQDATCAPIDGGVQFVVESVNSNKSINQSTFDGMNLLSNFQIHDYEINVNHYMVYAVYD